MRFELSDFFDFRVGKPNKTGGVMILINDREIKRPATRD
jgi:hypothetical protein